MSNRDKRQRASRSAEPPCSRQIVSIEISSDMTGFDVDFKMTFNPEPNPNDSPQNGAVSVAIRILKAMAEHE